MTVYFDQFTVVTCYWTEFVSERLHKLNNKTQVSIINNDRDYTKQQLIKINTKHFS